MKTEAPAPKRMGRPPSASPIKQPFSVSLDSRVVEGLRKYGGDNLSKGVGKAVGVVAERTGCSAALPDVRPALAGPVRAANGKAKATKKYAGGRVAKTKSRPLGRPVVGIARRVRTNVHLYPTDIEQLRILGGGVVSEGIERAAVWVRAVRL